ncbi:MAG: histone-like nucleoid-structuring protein Lsr2 [Streptosporangiaceae bacterium]
MAQKIQTLFIDDLDGGEAAGTVSFALDGADYEIDLSEAHAGELRAILTRYAGAGRKVTSSTRRPARRGGTAADGLSTTEIRDWAKANGVEIKDRGRIPAQVVAGFRAETGR